MVSSVDEVRSKEDRLVEISSELRIGERVRVSDLAERYGVSEVTIRSDLDTLEARHVITRVRGGAIRVAGDGAALHHTYESDFRHDLRTNVRAKRAIAEAAAEHVRDGDAIMLDDSGIAAMLAAELVRTRVRLLVATPSLPIAQSLMFKESFRVLLPGGSVHRARESLQGRFHDTMGGNLRFRTGFFAPAAFNVDDGMLELDPQIADVKRASMELCDDVTALVDSSTLGAIGIHGYGGPGAISTLLVDDDASAREVRRLRQAIADVRVIEI